MKLTDFYDGLGRYLRENGVANFPGGETHPGKPPIVFKGMPATPDEVIVITAYGATDTVGNLRLQDLDVQVRARGGKTDNLRCDEILDSIFELLHDTRYVEIVPDHKFRLIARKSSIPMGEDGNGRHARADNYKFFGQRS